MNKKAYLEISFSWMFAIIVGVIILFLAIYFLTSFIKTGQKEQELKASKEIGILLNPLEIGFEQGKQTKLTTSVNTRINPSCDLSGNFGRQRISVKEETYGKWSESDDRVVFQNKYVFSEENVEGKQFYLFSKSFESPFKVSSIIYLFPTKESYCFIDAPSNIEDEIKNLNFENIFLEDSLNPGDCSGDETQVCFNSYEECNINVDYSEGQGKITKGEQNLYFYDDSLMYAAIFSNQETYECQLRRLLMRTKILTQIYNSKLTLSSLSDCQNYLSTDLTLFENKINAYLIDDERTSSSLEDIFKDAKILNRNNRYSNCRLW